MKNVRVIENVRTHTLPTTAEEFLRDLGGPTFFHLEGRDRTRTRALTVLLHGNEPSGFRALHRFLRAREIPGVNIACFIGAVDAALHAPPFSLRMPPGRRDLNRVWIPPFKGQDGAIAEEALALIRATSPECALDLHNNTGHNPMYGVGPRIDDECRALVSLFSDIIVQNEIALGTFTEAMAKERPAVTLECGRAGDPLADEAAEAGLRRYLAGEVGASTVYALGEPIRVCVKPHVRLAFAERPSSDAELTFTHDIDRHNFQRVSAGHALGWVAPGAEWPFEACDAEGRERSRHFFELRGSEVVTREDIIPIMMTTSEVAAKIDCLFYIVRRL